MSLWDTVMSDTVGVAFRAATGNVDPWTKQELIDQEAAGNVAAGGDPVTSQAQAEADVTATLKTFTLGGDDRIGADPSQASVSIPSLRAELDTLHSATNDDGSGCGITNLAGCVPTIPTWVYWLAGGVLALGALYVLAPYVGLASNLTRRN
jgi:hypothetical protein